MIRHFTTSAYVIDDKKRVLLLWHHRLQSWMPPGGHMEENELPEECAIRECKEETGLDVEIVHTPTVNTFAKDEKEGMMMKMPEIMQLEYIPAYGGGYGKPAQEAHHHMDFIFRARPIDPDQALQLAEDEAGEIRWFTKAEIEALPEKDIFQNVKTYLMHAL